MNVEKILFFIAAAAYFMAMILYFCFLGLKKEHPGKAATYFQAGGFTAHTATLVVRGIQAGRVPMTRPTTDGWDSASS